jgi:AbiV family abortive infection protein
MIIRMGPEKICRGLELALKKCEELLSDAETLISKGSGSLNNAVALIEYAIEEFGRAVCLREKLEKGSNEIEAELFKSHEYKYNKAWNVLPPELKTIYEGTFDVTHFEGTAFDVGKETISPRTRLDAIFVNYDKELEEWKVGVRADSETLKRVIEGIREKLKTFRIDV